MSLTDQGLTMKRIAVALPVLALLSLGACASAPDEAAMTAEPAAQPQPVQAPGGEWVVVEDYAAGSVGALKSPYLGQVLTLDAGRAVDPAGQLCKTPSYWQSHATAGDALNHPPQPQAAHDPALRSIITVTCANAPFAVLVEQPDGSWLTRQNAWVLKLGKPAAKPLALAVATPIMAAIPDMPAPEPMQAKPKDDPRTLVYLASYKTEAQAKSGFRTLAKASPILARQQPHTQSVDLGKKGRWVRLYGMAASEAERKAICGQLGKRVDECGARNRE